MNRRTKKQSRPKKQGGGCLGCMTGVLFTLVLCMGVVAFTGNGQRLADDITVWLQKVQLGGDVVSVGFLPQLATQETPVPDAAVQAQPIQEEQEVPATAQEVLAGLEASTTLFADGITRYAYTTLTDAEKISYLLVAGCVFDMAEQVEIPTQGSTALEDIWVMIRADFPALFWVETSLTRTITTGDAQQVFFIPTYSITAAERATQEAELEQVASLYYDSLVADATDYQKVKAAYEFVITQASYQITDQDQTVYGALVQGQAVCAGYARAVQYLLNRVGVVCGYVAGDASGTEGSVTHAWNFVQIAGDYYYLDATWGEASWGTGIDYSYLCVNAEDLATTHFADTIYNLPAVAGTAYNYYRVQGYYLQAYTIADAQAAMDGQQASGYYTLRFASAEGLQTALASLIEAQEIYSILRALGTPTNSISYTYKEALNILIVFSQGE